MSGTFDPNAYVNEGVSGFDPESYVSESNDNQSDSTLGGYGRAALGAIQSGLTKIDSYTGAPVRAAIGALQNNMFAPGQAIRAAANQFGQDPSLAPTGEQIVENAGIPKGSLASKVAGFGMDVATNPTSYLPIGEIAGAAAKGVGSVLGVANGAEAIAGTAPAARDVADKFVTAAAKAPSSFARASATAAETMTGVDRNIAANYMANTNRINQIVDHYSGPEGYSEASHAADIRNNWRSVIQGTRSQMNGQISDALNGAAGKESVNASPINDAIEVAIKKADPVTQSRDIETLQDIKDKLGQMTDASGNIQLKRLQSFKQFTQDVASPAYDGAGNAIFPGGKLAAKQAKGIAGAARSLLIENSPDSVANAEETLSKLHSAEDTMNSQLLKDNGPVHAISRAGSNSGGIEARSLKQLQNITGYDFSQDAKDFATARAFAAPKFTPDWNGKSVLRAGLGAAAGTLASQVVPVPMEYAALGGAALTSPGALKAGINAMNIAGRAITAPVNAAMAAPGAISSALASPAGRAAVDIGAKTLLSSPATANVPTPSIPSNFAQQSQGKGPSAWIQQGIQRLGIKDQSMVNRLLSDPKGRNLLIQASDLTPGSRALLNISAQIRKGYGAS